MRSKRYILAALLMLAACHSQSDVQRDYTADQSGCQGMAEQNIDSYLPADRAITEADRNAQMVTLFSDCMGHLGWQVAKPKKAAEGAADVPAAKAQAAPPANTAPPPQTAARQPSAETTPMTPSPYAYGPPGMPPATYQPVYGTGPGRNF